MFHSLRRITNKVTLKIWRHILAVEAGGKAVSEVDIAFTRMSVYYHWSLVSRDLWKFDDAPLNSAREFMRQQGEKHQVALLNVEAEPGTEVLAFEITDIMQVCAEKTRELGIDSTCESKNDICLPETD
jgi:hypothetical protein